MFRGAMRPGALPSGCSSPSSTAAPCGPRSGGPRPAWTRPWPTTARPCWWPSPMCPTPSTPSSSTPSPCRPRGTETGRGPVPGAGQGPVPHRRRQLPPAAGRHPVLAAGPHGPHPGAGRAPCRHHRPLRRPGRRLLGVPMEPEIPAESHPAPARRMVVMLLARGASAGAPGGLQYFQKRDDRAGPPGRPGAAPDRHHHPGPRRAVAADPERGGHGARHARGGPRLRSARGGGQGGGRGRGPGHPGTERWCPSTTTRSRPSTGPSRPRRTWPS